MGYRYNLQSLTHAETVAPGEDVTIKMVWNNSGVAPIYYNCPVTLMLVDTAGNAIYEKQLSCNVTEWQPGRTTVEEVLSLPKNLKEGTYSLQVKMNTADENAETVYLAMEGLTENGSYELYSVNVSKKVVQNTSDDAKAEDTANENANNGGNVWKVVLPVVIAVVVIAAVAVIIIKVRKNKKK